MLDITLYSLPNCNIKDLAEPDGVAYEELSDELLEILVKSSKAQVKQLPKFIEKCEAILAAAPDASRADDITAVIAQARANLGDALSCLDDPGAEDELLRAVGEARDSGYASAIFCALQSLAIHYSGNKKYDDALTVHMMTSQVLGKLGTSMIWLVIDRMAYISSRSPSVDAAAFLYEWLSLFHNSPLQSLKHRATRLSKIGNIEQLAHEADHIQDSNSCWHIAISYAANLVLNNEERAATLLNQCEDAASQSDNPVWQSTIRFEKELVSRA
jgi:hypothetical protein